MFALLLHENMNPFYETISSFPTVIFTGLLLFCIFYWLIAVLGFIDIDFIDLDLDGDIDLTEGVEAQGVLAGLVIRFGLHGVPFIVMLTILSTLGWLMSYYSTFFLFKIVPDGLLQYLVGIPILLVVLVASAMLTSFCIRPLRGLFESMNPKEVEKHIIGQIVVVRSATVTEKRGQGLMADGGADLVLDIRASAGDEFSKGDEVVIIEKLASGSIYRVISKAEFAG